MITVTPKATEKAKELMTSEHKNYLRIAIKGGGCSGMEYHLALEDEKTDFDEEIELNGIKILIDKISTKFLKGATLDFKDTLTGGGFTVTNPDWKGTCGCGSSFEPKE